MNSWEEMIWDGYNILDMHEKVAIKQFETDSGKIIKLIKTILKNSYIEKIYQQRKEG